ncbi:MAG: hypothetical protein V1794_19285 [Candidatus Glassbacteria bacterium]
MTVVRIRTLLALCAMIGTFAATACDNEHNVNAGNLVTLSGYVFKSRYNRVGVADVTVHVEKSPESGSPTAIPDFQVRTDAKGRWEVRFTLSYTSGNSPLEVVPQFIEESMRILMVSPENKFLDLGSGFSVQAGKIYNIWDVFLEDFVSAQPN